MLTAYTHYIAERVKSKTSEVLLDLGGILLLAGRSLLGAFQPPFRFSMTFSQMRFIGVHSLFIVILTGLFTGMVFALQSGRAFRLFNAESLTGAVAGLSLSRELAPVLTALMVTARAGSAMAAELGTMRVTQQVDALVSMAVNPVNYLVVPRFIATLIMVPLLTGIFNFVGALGSYSVGVNVLNINAATFLANMQLYVDPEDLLQGLVKSLFFAVMIVSISCYRGLNTSGGAKGVGRSTTRAVVAASVAILVGDYFLTALLF